MSAVMDPDRAAERRVRAHRAWSRELIPTSKELADEAIHRLISRGVPPMSGGATGHGPALTFVNGPAPNFVVNPDLFNQRTTMNVFQGAQKAWPGFGQLVQFDLPKRGIIESIEVIANLSVVQTHGTGTNVLTDYAKALSLYSQAAIMVDGSPLINPHAIALTARLQAASRNAPMHQDVIPFTASTSGTALWEIHSLFPVAYDDASLYGALFSQSDSLQAQLWLTTEVLSNLFAITGNDTLAVTGTLTPVFKTYDVPDVPTNQGGTVAVIPDLDIVHRILEYNVPIVASGDTTLYLPEVPGQMQRLFIWMDNTLGSLIDPAAISGIRFVYAETETPINYSPISKLLAQNARKYNGRVGAYNLATTPWVNTPKVAVLDFAASNARNALYPANVTKPNVVVTIPNTVTINAGARLYVAAEWLEGIV